MDSSFGLVTLHMESWSHQIKECAITVPSLHEVLPDTSFSARYACYSVGQSLLQPVCLPAFSQFKFMQAMTVLSPPLIPPVSSERECSGAQPYWFSKELMNKYMEGYTMQKQRCILVNVFNSFQHSASFYSSL